MSINLFHNLNTIKASSSSLPLVLDAPMGVIIPNVSDLDASASAHFAGTIYFDIQDKFLKYHNGTSWVILGPTDGITSKANKQSAVDIGGAGYGPGKYLTSDNGGQTLWKDPKDDGFLAFNKRDAQGSYETFVLNNNFLFTGANKFTQAVDMQNNVIANVVASAATDAIPKSYVDSLVAQKVADLQTQYQHRVSLIESKYQTIVNTIVNTGVPNPPEPPQPPVPNPVRAYLIETNNKIATWTGKNQGTNPNPASFANDAHSNAVAQNGGRLPAAGSVYVYTVIHETWTAGSKGASSVTSRSFIKFTWNGSSVVYNYFA